MDANRDSALSLAFMRGHPANAARVLEGLSAPDAAAIFDRAPARIGADVLAAMLPRQASNCVAALSDARALELLSAMNMQATVSLLRYCPEPRRAVLMAGLPTASALASALLLGYSDDTLGAWADPDIVMLAAATRASDALERVRQANSPHAIVFVADTNRHFSGIVELPALLRAPPSSTLATLMQRPGAVLAANAPLAGTAAHPAWQSTSLLAVVEPGDRLVGVITRDALARALQRDLPTPKDRALATSLPQLVARSYWQTLTGMVGAGLTLLPRVPPAVAAVTAVTAAPNQPTSPRLPDSAPPSP